MTNDTILGSDVVTRFAPSPTGFLHIGGARTALFNWLYAKHTGGKFLLRIEDTDRKRNSPEAIAAILDGLAWLGLEWDGEAVSQFSRADRHREVVQDLLAKGAAYKCYLTPEELDAMREEAQAAKQRLRIRSPWRDRDPGEAPGDSPAAIRLKAPQDGETIINDIVQGDVVYQNAELDDLILVRSDGTPTYNLAVVVDDHDMGVNHVVRGVDHLTNAARQVHIYTAMGWRVPQFAHVPLIHGSDGAKLSKRHGALGVEAYREMGYLPAALRNYLVRLGWSHGDDEIFSTEQLIDWFELTAIGKSPARFDLAKLEDLNAQYIRNMANDDLLAAFKASLRYLVGGSEFEKRMDVIGWSGFRMLLASLKERARTLNDLIAGSSFLLAERPLAITGKAKKALDNQACERLIGLATALEAVGDWQPKELEDSVGQYLAAGDLKLGQVAQPLRVALTASTASPPIFDVLAALGRDEALARIRDCK